MRLKRPLPNIHNALTIIETFEDKTHTQEVEEILYLGAVISCDRKSFNFFLQKTKPSLGH